MVKELGKEIIDWINRKDRCYVSTLAYILCAILVFLSVASTISPFSISISFIDNIVWKSNLTSTSLLVNITFIIDMLSLIVSFARNVALKKAEDLPNAKYKEKCSNYHTVDDIVDMFAAICSLFFMISVFLQMYKTQVFFATFQSLIIYVFIVYKMLSNLWYIFKARNLSIIERVLEKYKDFD